MQHATDWQSDAEATIEAHLAAVVGRDLDTYRATLHPDVTVIIPSGRQLTGADEVGEFHREWFADDGWTYVTVDLRSTATTRTATRIVEVTYTGEPGAEPSRFVMGLTFVCEGDRWLLIHDQCTILHTD